MNHTQGKRERLRGTHAKVIFAAFACAILVAAAFFLLRTDGVEEPELVVTIDEAKVCLISGNFSVAITRDWPRVIFKHDADPFSPTFEVSCPRMYAHNDTDGDGLFDLDEAILTMFLDSNHVEWEMTPIVQDYSSEFGGYASFGMKTELNAYVVDENETLVMSDWAHLSFWFLITEKSVEYANSKGTYEVGGGTQLRMNFSLFINDCIDVESLVLSQFLQGGASTSMFTLLESDGEGKTVFTNISGAVDERELDAEYPHEFRATSYPTQEILFSKEDGVDQAYYYWGSEARAVNGDNSTVIDIDSSYYTTGNGMMLHSTFYIDNCTTQLDYESSTGIIESGFIGGVRDWIREYSEPLMIVGVVTASFIAVGLVFWQRRKRRALSDAPEVDKKE